MQNDRLLYKLLLSTVTLLLVVVAALPALMQENTLNPVPIPNDAFELTGMLESINNQEIVVDGIPIDIRIANLNTRLTLGDLISVEGSLKEGVFTARDVGPPLLPDVVTTPEVSGNESSGVNNDNFEFRGIVESIDDGFVISGQRVNFPNNQATIPLVVGQLVKVKGTLQAGLFSAREIRTANDDGFFDDDFDDRVNNIDELSISRGCVVNAPAGWVSYSIRSGDTLSSIASRSGSRVSELVQVNCLENPRFIVVGSTLWLPRTPASFTAPNRGNESSGSRQQNRPGNESSGSRPQNFPSSPRGGNESSGSNSNSNSSSDS